MASPSRAELETMIANAVHPIDELNNYTTDNATNFIGMLDTFIQSLETDYAAETSNGMATFRSLLNSALQQGRNVLVPLFREYAKFINSPNVDKDIDLILNDIYTNMVDNTISVVQRGITFGTIASSGSNVGSGNIARLTVDKNNLAIESVNLETKTMSCFRDMNTGAVRNKEIFKFKGQARGRDALQLGDGSNLNRSLAAVDHTDSIVLNAGFRNVTVDSGTTLTAMDNWTVGSNWESLEKESNVYFRSVGKETSPTTIKFVANDTIIQTMDTVNRDFEIARPYYCQLSYNRVDSAGSGDGTLQVGIGSVTASVTLSAETGWNQIIFPLGSNSWYDNFKEDNIDVFITLSGNTLGEVVIDDLILVPMTQIDQLWYTIIGSTTRFLKDDNFSVTDALAGSEAKIQLWMWRLFRRYLPHLPSGSATWSDP